MLVLDTSAMSAVMHGIQGALDRLLPRRSEFDWFKPQGDWGRFQLMKLSLPEVPEFPG